MSDELKPCPFCGGGVELKYIVSDHAIYCPECDRHFWEQEARHPHPGRAGLIEWWNTRADRTCHIRYHGGMVSEGGMEAEDWYFCDACGYELDDQEATAWNEYEFHDFEGAMPFRRCPDCGAKIVSLPDGTCRMIKVSLYDEEGVEGIECDECEWSDMHDWCDPMPARCPGCNRKVVSE